jgi:polyhydroxybutyrate depolymerase
MAQMFIRGLLLAVALAAAGSAAMPVFAADISPPAGNWAPGDIPSTGGAPGGSDYIGISGVSGQNGLTREYKVHIPSSYRVGVATPLVFCLPGLGTTTTMYCVNGTNTVPFAGSSSGNGTSGGFITQSDDNGFILVMAEGYDVSWDGYTCCGAAQIDKLDDVALIRAILAQVEEHVTIDISRVYAVGFSNGAFMADRLACEASDIIAGIMTGSGGLTLYDNTTVIDSCKPTNHVAVLATHGTSDAFVPYSGGDQATMAQFAKMNGCGTTTSKASFPPSAGSGSGAVSCITYDGCPSGTAVTFCSVTDGGHCWYGSPSCGTGVGALGADIALFGGVNTQNIVDSDVFWPFLKNYSR